MLSAIDPRDPVTIPVQSVCRGPFYENIVPALGLFSNTVGGRKYIENLFFFLLRDLVILNSYR